ncbi:hypothetical protein H696_06226 [Fonticula alba]|uniref:ribonucleoside-triphosphate reductase (thioredoxin) n=1 Tax=Fonticula alba TaxID=691883 RepID=A0A058YZD6_FONAL|nr:hypothetical protein H696_06226 [Fonticula alba]KCV67344.1 hypothetical protein H696_06226 [Fonticula alba]|eukprot:XP_009498247.1 hypothetical protein H696_06226 [Fonticula alba]
MLGRALAGPLSTRSAAISAARRAPHLAIRQLFSPSGPAETLTARTPGPGPVGGSIGGAPLSALYLHQGPGASWQRAMFSTTACAGAATAAVPPPAGSLREPSYFDGLASFRLPVDFLRTYAGRPVPFGFNGLGHVVFHRTYSRVKTPDSLAVCLYGEVEGGDNPDAGVGQYEQWWETVARVVTGTFRMQERWCRAHHIGWDESQALAEATEMYDAMFHMRFLPPGRGLWAMGSELTENPARRADAQAALFNCGFPAWRRGPRSMGDLLADAGSETRPSRPFSFLMDGAMLGVGIGFDTAAAYPAPPAGTPDTPATEAHRATDRLTFLFRVPDSRLGWVESVALLVDSYLIPGSPAVRFDYGDIRPAGAPVRGFGGKALGPDPLRRLHAELRGILSAAAAGTEWRGIPLEPGASHPVDDRHASTRPAVGRMTSTTVVDIMNIIGKCIVSGGVRATAELALGSPHDPAYAALKQYAPSAEGEGPDGSPGPGEAPLTDNSHRMAFGWTSNNSVVAPVGLAAIDGPRVIRHLAENGEPGLFFLDTAREFGRLVDPADWADIRAAGANPCLEQTLESFELCCLVETFPFRHLGGQSIGSAAGGGAGDAPRRLFVERTLRSAMLYAKTVTLANTHWPATNRAMLRNRRVGCSMSGIAQLVESQGLEALRVWCDEGYAAVKKYDELFSERFAIRKSIKLTSIKPSGTVSLLAGATPGLHYPESRYCIRRVRIPSGPPLDTPNRDPAAPPPSDLVLALMRAGYPVEPAVEAPGSTCVVEFPVDMGSVGMPANVPGNQPQEQQPPPPPPQHEQPSTIMRSLDDVTMWEQLALAAFLQRHWADNQVSCTVTVAPSERAQIPFALNYYQYQLKGISFLPRIDAGAYPQMPYERISPEEYQSRVARIRPIDIPRGVPGLAGVGGVSPSERLVATTLGGEDAPAVPLAAQHAANNPPAAGAATPRPRDATGGDDHAFLEQMPDLFCETDTCAIPR